MNNEQPVRSSGFNFDYMKILAALGRNILVIILAALIGGGAMFGYTFFFTSPSYSAEVLVYINKSSVSISDMSLTLSNSDDVLSTYVTILNSRTTLEEIAEKAGVNYAPETLKKMISTSESDGTSFLTVTVYSGSPTEAELLANTIASVLPTRVSDIVEGSTLRVVDYAVVPSSRSTASLFKNFLIGLVAGAAAVAVVVALREFIVTNHAPVINSRSELTEYYPQNPVLGVIRDLSVSEGKYAKAKYGYGKYAAYYSDKSGNSDSTGKKKTHSSDKQHRFCCENVPFSSLEDYKRLRTNIRFCFSGDSGSRVIGITSAQPADGKTLTAVNLAYSFAQIPEKRVLLIDCDMRRPSVSSKLSFQQAPGLSNLLSGVDDDGEVKNVYNPSDNSASFDVITCGSVPPNPSELLASDRMKRLIDKLKTYYDFILLDLPPVGAVTDAQIASAITDGMVIVVREGFCSRPLMDDCIDQLNMAGAHILGFVLNGSVESISRGYKYKKYSRYGGYGYGYGYGGYYGGGYGVYGNTNN